MAAETGIGRATRLVREPVVHFFVVALLLFAANRLFLGAPRTIIATAGVKGDLSRKWEELNGRPPTAAELAAEVRKWQFDEALFREAIRDGLDQDDPGIRAILVDKMRLRALFRVSKREPTEAELDSWLASHRSVYETPVRFDFEFIAVSKGEPRAQEKRDELGRAIEGGKNATSLGRPVIGGNLTAPELEDRVEPELAEAIPRLSPSASGWQRLETRQSFVLARLKGVSGGAPSRERLRAQLTEDWKQATQKAAAESILQQTIQRYRFEEQR